MKWAIIARSLVILAAAAIHWQSGAPVDLGEVQRELAILFGTMALSPELVKVATKLLPKAKAGEP